MFEVAGRRGRWRSRRQQPAEWVVAGDGLRMLLRPNDFGHLGLFPEHTQFWPWIEEQCRPGMSVLNLFAHTGGATLAAAMGGASVTHVDAASSMKGWARKNAELSGLAQAPIRWVTEDALKFADRELRRGRRYDAVILDPPTYGRGPGNEIWRIESSLEQLLEICRGLLTPSPRFVLLTCHTQGYTPKRLRRLAGLLAPDAPPREHSAQWLSLTSETGKTLSCGAAAFWRREGSAEETSGAIA